MHYIQGNMTQQIIGRIAGRIEFLDLPDPDQFVLPGIRWGSFEQPLTPAFWASQAWLNGQPDRESFRLGAELKEEVVYCLLGGHGAPAEVGLAASKRVCAALSANGILSLREIETLLLEPLKIGQRTVRYRFARQRARYLAGTLEMLATINQEESDDVCFRNALLALPGIGPKTASWIVRNHRGSDAVAILDVHIVRACIAMGIFPQNANLARDYTSLERAFLEFCQSTCTGAAVMDALMWSTMRVLSRSLLQLLVDQDGTLKQPPGHNAAGRQRCQAQTAVVTKMKLRA